MLFLSPFHRVPITPSPRFHVKTLTELDCAEVNSPEARDDPSLLWRVDQETGEETFLHNISFDGGIVELLDEVSFCYCFICHPTINCR